jgi:hypothetical protein
METVVLLLIGAFIGWNFPQPFWAKAMQVRVEAWWSKKK